MAALKEEVSYFSLSNLGKENRKFNYVDDLDDTASIAPESKSPKALNQKISYPFLFGSEDFVDGGYDSGDDQYTPVLKNSQPEVNLRNVVSGLFAILTARSKDLTGLSSLPHLPSSNVSCLGSAKNGETFLHSSVYIPSAPLLLVRNSFKYDAYKEVLEAEPPQWLPDSSTTVCMQCNAPFTALTRGRHHCRFCGGIFCRMCSKGRCLLPAKFRERNPQRVCDTCYDRLDPLQSVLVNTISNAAQVAKHDVMDWTCSRGWLNLPVSLSMEQEIYKSISQYIKELLPEIYLPLMRGTSSATRKRFILRVARLNHEKSIPSAVLRGARGLAILTVVKGGMLLAYKFGTGLVVARRSDGSWSAPSAILSVGLGWGAQVGGELMDFIIVLHDSKAVKTFCSSMHCSLGLGCSAAAGLIGRVVEADLRAGEKGSGMCYTYSCSKGAFVGVSLEGNIVATRRDKNFRFYGDPYLTTADILLGTVDRPKAAEPLYAAIRDLQSRLQC